VNRIVLRSSVCRDDIDDALAEQGCRLINVVPPTASLPGQMIYATRDRQGTLYLVEDAQLGLNYFAGVGEGIDEELEQLKQRLACMSEEDLDELRRSADDDATRIHALSAMAIMSSEELDEDQRTFWRDSLEHGSAAVRYGALVALAYARWPSIRPLLHEIADKDEEAMIRLQAQRVLDLLGS
jgi:hypothetical protein